MMHRNELEILEARRLFSAPAGLSPSAVRHAYGFDQLAYRSRRHWVAADGTGETIAIVDAFHAPTIAADLRVFDRAFGLLDTDGLGAPVLTVAHPGGTPPVDTGWASEVALDVEWAHAIAPGAHILLVEAASDNTSDLLNAIDYARRQTGVVAVSLSWGGDESPFETSDDAILTTPRRHVGGYGLRGGVTYVTSSGDNGAPTSWPASSPNVVAVGGTSLTLDSRNRWAAESAWSGSGGGPSTIEGTYAPDVAYDADPNTGFAVYDSTPDQGVVGWDVIGGTSAGAPQWAALIAIADQGRALNGVGALDGPTQTLDAIYSMPQSAFHDIVTGSNGYPAKPGYDLVTGRGTPQANVVVPNLIAFRGSSSNPRPAAALSQPIASAKSEAIHDPASLKTLIQLF